MKYSKDEKAKAIEKLHELIKPGDTVYTVVNHVSRSGMSRWISAYVIIDNAPFCIDRWVRVLEDQPYSKTHDGIYMSGCGMDMGFALVYDLSYHLFPDGYGCIGERCPSNDHSNGDQDYRKHMENDAPIVCPFCKGTGKRNMQGFGGKVITECQICKGKGTLPPEHWHKSGGYAIKQRWLS